jgi:hypothetical protein
MRNIDTQHTALSLRFKAHLKDSRVDGRVNKWRKKNHGDIFETFKMLKDRLQQQPNRFFG